MSEDMVYGCDTCRTTLGRAGCPTHRGSNTYTDAAGAYHYTGSQLVMTHCIHGLDLRLYPRCYLCTPESARCGGDHSAFFDEIATLTAEIARLRRIEEAARALIASAYPDSLDKWGALRAALEEDR